MSPFFSSKHQRGLDDVGGSDGELEEESVIEEEKCWANMMRKMLDDVRVSQNIRNFK